MKRISTCPCCDAPISRTIPTAIAPFVRERALGGGAPTGALSDCPACGFRCYVDRYDDVELTALYRGYRDAEYARQRRRHEPWYTASFNAAIGGPGEVARRTRRLEAFLLNCGVLPAARSVLDWGGDRGQFIPLRFAERFVYDISGIEPVTGVTTVTAAQLNTRCYDLVLCSHVLEHASDPLAQLREILTISSTYLYVEVPFEPVRLSERLTRPEYERWVRAIVRSKLYPFVAFASLVSRMKLGVLPPFGVLQQHEHVNFFTEATLRRMLERAGCRIVASVLYQRDGQAGPIDAMAVVAQPLPARQPSPPLPR